MDQFAIHRAGHGGIGGDISATHRVLLQDTAGLCGWLPLGGGPGSGTQGREDAAQEGTQEQKDQQGKQELANDG